MLFHWQDWSVQHPSVSSKNEQYNKAFGLFLQYKRMFMPAGYFSKCVSHRRIMSKLKAFTFQYLSGCFTSTIGQFSTLAFLNRMSSTRQFWFISAILKSMSVPAGLFSMWVCYRRMMFKLDPFTFKYLSCCFIGTIGQFSTLVFLQRMNITTSLWFISAI